MFILQFLLHTINFVRTELSDTVTDRIKSELQTIKQEPYFDYTCEPVYSLMRDASFLINLKYTTDDEQESRIIAISYDNTYPSAPPLVNFFEDRHHCDGICKSNLVPRVFKNDWNDNITIHDICLDVVKFLEDNEEMKKYESAETCCFLVEQREHVKKKF